MENDKRLEYFKKHIKEKLESVKDDIPDRRYRLWIAAIDDCEDYDELREMAELDMQLDMFEYTRNEINPKLQRLNLEMDEIRGAKTMQEPSKTTGKTLGTNEFSSLTMPDSDDEEEYTTGEMLEDLDDPEMEAAMAAIIAARMASEPWEEANREEMLDSIIGDTSAEEDIEGLSEEDFGDLADAGDSLEVDEDDFDIDEDELDIEEDDGDEDTSDDIESSEEGSDEDDGFGDFFGDSDSDEDTENIDDDEMLNGIEGFEDFEENDSADTDEKPDESQNNSHGDISDFLDFDEEDGFGKLKDKLGIETSEQSIESDEEDIDNMSEDDLEQALLGDEEDDGDVDGISDDDFGDIFDDSSEDSDSTEEINDDDFEDMFIDSDDSEGEGNLFESDDDLEGEFGDLDSMFEDSPDGDDSDTDEDSDDDFNDFFSDEDDSDSSDADGEDDIDNLDLGDFLEEDDSDIFSDDAPSQHIDKLDDLDALFGDGEADSDGLDNIDESDLLGDDSDDADNSEESDEESEDDLFGNIPGLDDFADDGIEDDSSSFFDAQKNKASKSVTTSVPTQKQPEVKKIQATNVFINGSERGQKTQDMFNSITRANKMMGSVYKKFINKATKAAKDGQKKLQKSSMFELPSEN